MLSSLRYCLSNTFRKAEPQVSLLRKSRQVGIFPKKSSACYTNTVKVYPGTCIRASWHPSNITDCVFHLRSVEPHGPCCETILARLCLPPLCRPILLPFATMQQLRFDPFSNPCHPNHYFHWRLSCSTSCDAMKSKCFQLLFQPQ